MLGVHPQRQVEEHLVMSRGAMAEQSRSSCVTRPSLRGAWKSVAITHRWPPHPGGGNDDAVREGEAHVDSVMDSLEGISHSPSSIKSSGN